MAEARDIPAGTYDLKLGETFQDTTDKAAYHTLRFDFKPKSVASETETYLAFGGNGDVQVAVPGEGDSLTIYKGAQKPVKADKECLLFFDHNTGELRLEKLSSNISVKKTRDTDEGTVSVIRNEIQKLRKKAKTTVDNENEDEEMEDTKSSTGSSSSSSSESGDSDSDSSSSSAADRGRTASGTAKEAEADSSDGEDNNSASGSNDDDDLQDQLEQHLNADSMPSIDNTSSYHSGSKQQTTYSSAHHQHSNTKKLLDDDLQLSESSDDD
ncbi:ELL-associated factor 2 [Toxocara canis]|uniref:Ell-associated factor Eaf n=1 Tax=Toxocara canis TaxID=6265 RepID=A0A0B2VKN6_TOXCA|nr:ELL-associated factor 2 [Toxocara canis]